MNHVIAAFFKATKIQKSHNGKHYDICCCYSNFKRYICCFRFEEEKRMADKVLLEFPILCGDDDEATKHNGSAPGFYYKAICQLLILVGLTSTGYFIYQGTQLAPQTQFLFAVVIQSVYCIVYPIIMLMIDCRWETFKRHFMTLGWARATLCGCLWSVNNVFITVPASHLSGFYQTLGIGFSFVGCFFIEKIVQGTQYTRGQVVCIGMAIAVFIMLALAETGTDISATTLIWWICFLLNQLAANYAQVLLENSWKQSKGEENYKVAHGNFVTNVLGMPFFFCSVPFYFSQNNNLDTTYIWIPILIAFSAIIYTFGSNVLLQVEDMTYSMMSGTACNLTTLVLIVCVPWNIGSTNVREVTAYILTVIASLVYMSESSDHSGRGNLMLQAKQTSHAVFILLTTACAIVILAYCSDWF